MATATGPPDGGRPEVARVAMAGGTLHVRARPGQGTSLVAHLPLAPEPLASG